MAVRVGAVMEAATGFGQYEIVETEIVHEVNTVIGYMRMSRKENPNLKRNRRKEREIDGLIVNQNGGTVRVLVDGMITSILCVYEV